MPTYREPPSDIYAALRQDIQELRDEIQNLKNKPYTTVPSYDGDDLPQDSIEGQAAVLTNPPQRRSGKKLGYYIDGEWYVTDGGPIPAVRVWKTIPANQIAPNAAYVPDLSSGSFKSNDPDSPFQARTNPFTDGTYFNWVTTGSGANTNYLTVTGPGLFLVRAWWSLTDIFTSLIPVNDFRISLRSGGAAEDAPESDDPTSTKAVPFAPTLLTAPTPDIIGALGESDEKIIHGAVTETAVGNQHHIEIEHYMGLRNSSTVKNIHLDMAHNLRNNSGTLITMDFATDAGLSVFRLGDFV